MKPYIKNGASEVARDPSATSKDATAITSEILEHRADVRADSFISSEYAVNIEHCRSSNSKTLLNAGSSSSVANSTSLKSVGSKRYDGTDGKSAPKDSVKSGNSFLTALVNDLLAMDNYTLITVWIAGISIILSIIGIFVKPFILAGLMLAIIGMIKACVDCYIDASLDNIWNKKNDKKSKTKK